MTATSNARWYGFGAYRLDVEAGRLWRDGEPVPITPKALHILHLLVTQPGRIVTKEEVRALVWPGVHVGEKNLTVQMVAVRRALGDISNRPLFVETVPRRGYRFIAPVHIEHNVPSVCGANSRDEGLSAERKADGSLSTPILLETRAWRRSWYVQAASLSLALGAFLVFRQVETFGAAPPRVRTGTDLALFEAAQDTDREAHELYLKGRYFWSKRTSVGLEKAVYYFNKSIQNDPTYALGYAGLADSYAVLADGRGPSREYLPRAAAAAEKALSLDGRLAEPYLPLAFSKACDKGDWAGAGVAFQKSIELSPNYATAHQWYGIYLADLGRFDEAIFEGKRAHELDPLSPTISTALAGIYYRARRYTEAIGLALEALEIEPAFADAHEILADISWQQGAYGRWLNESIDALRLEGASEAWLETLRLAYARTGAKGCVRTRLKVLEAEAQREYVSPLELAQLHARLGETEDALNWIERALEQRESGLENLGVDPAYDSLRGRARFHQCLRRTGLVS